MSWNYRKAIVISHAQNKDTVDLLNFPMLFSVTDVNLATVANGGLVQYSNGSDITFTDSNNILLDFEVESYNATTGTLVAWVRIPTFSLTVDTTIYIYFGNTAIVTSQANTTGGVWDGNYADIWHMADNAATTTVVSTSQFVDNGTNQANTNTKQTAGEIDGALTYNGSTDFTSIGNSSHVQQTSGTFSAWIKTSSPGSGNRGVVGKDSAYALLVDASLLSTFDFSTSTQHDTTMNVADGNWHYLVMTFRSGVASGTILYGDGVSKLTTIITILNQNNNLNIGANNSSTQTINAIIDEVRFSYNSGGGNTGVRSAGWILTEYNNQFSPAMFYSVGGLQILSQAPSTAIPGSGATLPTRGRDLRERTLIRV